MEEEYYNRYYITTDSSGNITDGWSDGPHPGLDTTNAILLSDKGGYQFRLTPDGPENPPLYDYNYNLPLYRWDGSQVVPRDDAELEEERAAYRAEEERQTQINFLKSQLAATDYQAIKYAEGWFSAEEYAEAKALRQSLRDQINALES